MITVKRLLSKGPLALAAVTTGVVAFSSGAYANYDDGNTTITTSFTREAHEQYCYADNYCTSDFHFPLISTCTKTASSRVRFQRDALPDETEAEKDNFTTCTNYYWDNFRSESSHGHHMDGKVTSGTGKEHFFFTDEHDYN